jgi:hypothetical protein
MRPPLLLSGAATLVLVGIAMSPAWADAAARVEFAVGQGRALRADGVTRALQRNAEVFVGETIVTGRDARVALRFSDGGYVALQPESRLRIESYHFDGAVDGGERSYLSLLKGGLRAITGIIGRVHKPNFRLITRAATVGVRGTEYALRYTDELVASVRKGEIVLCNGSGCNSALQGEAYAVPASDVGPVLVVGPAQALPPDAPVLP